MPKWPYGTHGMQCMVVNGGHVIIRSKSFIDSEVIWAMGGAAVTPEGVKIYQS